MSSGFTQRFKGKIVAQQLWLAGTQITASGADINTNAGVATVTTSTSSTAPIATTHVAGVDILAPTALSGGSIYRLPAPNAGASRIIAYSTLNGSTVLFVTASTVAGVVFSGIGSTGSTASFAGSGGSTLSNTFKSTQSCQVELMGLSTAAWLVMAVLPSTSGGITWSTST